MVWLTQLECWPELLLCILEGHVFRSYIPVLQKSRKALELANISFSILRKWLAWVWELCYVPSAVCWLPITKFLAGTGQFILDKYLDYSPSASLCQFLSSISVALGPYQFSHLTTPICFAKWPLSPLIGLLSCLFLTIHLCSLELYSVSKLINFQISYFTAIMLLAFLH